MAKYKLLKVEWTINIYDKNDELLKEIEINISLDELKRLITANDNDPLICDGYELNAEQIHKLNNFASEKINPRFDTYSYLLVGGGIYDWSQPQ